MSSPKNTIDPHVHSITQEDTGGTEHRAIRVSWTLVEEILDGKYYASPSQDDRIREFLIKHACPDWLRRADHLIDDQGLTFLGPRTDPPTRRVEIWHVSEGAPLGTRFREHPEAWEERCDHYERVTTGEHATEADVDTTAVLEAIWLEEQNGDFQEPPEGHDVSLKEGRRRSLSVGDVIVLDGTPYEVGRVGFRMIAVPNYEDTSGERPRPIPEEK